MMEWGAGPNGTVRRLLSISKIDGKKKKAEGMTSVTDQERDLENGRLG